MSAMVITVVATALAVVFAVLPKDAAPRLDIAPTLARPCGLPGKPPRRYEHVVWIVMENKSYSRIVGAADAPYINAIAKKCGIASDFYAETHPSLPNYIAMTSGGTQDVTDDAGPEAHQLAVPSIFSQLGSGWRALQESMPSNCSSSDTDLYAPRHNPALYYPDVKDQCAAQNVPLQESVDLSARFTFVTPNICNDMHDKCGGGLGDVEAGDRWLSLFLPKILSSTEYRVGETVVFITWDEEDDSSRNQIPTIVISPYTTTGTVSTQRFDHYSLLRTTEELLGIDTYLGKAAQASSMRSAFHL